MKYNFIFLLLILASYSGYSQENILDNPVIQQQVESCLYKMYNFRFDEARSIQNEIKHALPKHPVSDFLEAQIIYWENLPLLPEEKQTEDFLKSMEKSISNAKKLLKDDPNDVEGVFFDLHARAFTTMFWADNGKYRKVIKDIDNLYRRTMQGIEMKDKFNEFYFSSGLYNYYIEAYIETHPVYKPLSVLFRKGNKEKGLQEIQYAIDNSTYIKVESIFFMSLLQLNYEKNIPEALEYAAKLYNNFPENTDYIARYLVILLHQDEFVLAGAILQRLEQKGDDFSHMLHHILKAFILENKDQNMTDAERLYRQGLTDAEKFGPFVNVYKAIGFAGLSRIYEDIGDDRLSKKYRNKSRSFSKYEFILSY